MIKRVLLALVGLAALAAAAAVTVVAAAFALYALLIGDLGPAGAAAATAGAAVLLILLVALVAGTMAKGGVPARRHRDMSLGEKLTDFAKDRPVLAAGAALAAGLIALKNPKLAAGLASAFMAGKAADKTEDRRRRW